MGLKIRYCKFMDEKFLRNLRPKTKVHEIGWKLHWLSNVRTYFFYINKKIETTSLWVQNPDVMKLLIKIYFLIDDQKPRSRTSSKILESFCYENFFLYFPKSSHSSPMCFILDFMIFNLMIIFEIYKQNTQVDEINWKLQSMTRIKTCLFLSSQKNPCNLLLGNLVN